MCYIGQVSQVRFIRITWTITVFVTVLQVHSGFQSSPQRMKHKWPFGRLVSIETTVFVIPKIFHRVLTCLNPLWDVWKMSIPAAPTSAVTDEPFSPSPELLSTIALSVLLFVFLITNTVLCCLYRRRRGWFTSDSPLSPRQSHANVSTSTVKQKKRKSTSDFSCSGALFSVSLKSFTTTDHSCEINQHKQIKCFFSLTFFEKFQFWKLS